MPTAVNAQTKGTKKEALKAAAKEALANHPNIFLVVAAKAGKWEVPAEPRHIAGPLYFVGTEGLGVWLIKSSAGLILLNTGMPGSGPMIEKSIRTLGFNPKDIKLLLASHAHIDHAGGHAYIEKISGAKVAMIAEEVPLLTSDGRTDFFYKNLKKFEYEPVAVDQVLHDGETITLGDISMTAHLTQGHSIGSTSWTMKITDNGTPYSVIFPDGTGANPGYRVRVNPSLPGLENQFRKTFDFLASQKPDIWLGNHNDTYGFKEKATRAVKEGAAAWVDPDGYAKWVAEARKQMDALVAKELAGR